MNSSKSKLDTQQEQEQVRAITVDTGVSPDYDHSRHRRQSGEYDHSAHDQLGKSPDYTNANRVFFSHHSTCSCKCFAQSVMNEYFLFLTICSAGRGSGVGCDCAMSCHC